MSGDEFLDQFNDDDPPDTGEQPAFGEVMYPWRSPHLFNGTHAPAPRRPELLGDMEEAWWADVSSWTDWLIVTYRLSRWLPPCWLRHPTLVEEAQALWLVWCDAWMPAVEPQRPAQFLGTLAAALARIETLWQIPCRPDSHTEPAPQRTTTSRVRPLTRDWWSMPEFDPAATSW